MFELIKDSILVLIDYMCSHLPESKLTSKIIAKIEVYFTGHESTNKNKSNNNNKKAKTTSVFSPEVLTQLAETSHV